MTDKPDSGIFEVEQALREEAPVGPRRASDTALLGFMRGPWSRFLERFHVHDEDDREQTARIKKLEEMNIGLVSEISELKAQVRDVSNRQQFVLDVVAGEKNLEGVRQGGIVSMLPDIREVLRIQRCIIKTVRFVIVPLLLALAATQHDTFAGWIRSVFVENGGAASSQSSLSGRLLDR